MLKTQKVCWWRRGPANTEGKLGKEPDGEMGSIKTGSNWRLFIKTKVKSLIINNFKVSKKVSKLTKIFKLEVSHTGMFHVLINLKILVKN